jgi:Tetracyclin repressor-like, C-terminal domain
LVTNDLVLRVALEAAHDPELATALDDLMLFRGRRTVATILAQAAARGEIPADNDRSLVSDVILAMGLLRVIRGQTR